MQKHIWNEQKRLRAGTLNLSLMTYTTTMCSFQYYWSCSVLVCSGQRLWATLTLMISAFSDDQCFFKFSVITTKTQKFTPDCSYIQSYSKRFCDFGTYRWVFVSPEKALYVWFEICQKLIAFLFVHIWFCFVNGVSSEYVLWKSTVNHSDVAQQF